LIELKRRLVRKQQIQKPAPLRQQVYELIMSYIGIGFYKPGDRLTEERIAKDLGVSRTPVREALSQLDINGLLVNPKSGGYFVRSLSVEEIAHIFEVRTLLEPYAIACLTRKPTENQLQALDRALREETEHIDDNSPDAFARANKKFRDALFEDLANTELKRCIAQFDDAMQLIRLVTLSDLAARRTVVKGHKEMLAAISARDQNCAKQAMLRHIENAKKCVVEAMEKERDQDYEAASLPRMESSQAM
jgi:DNA-binding GntR family transcriptional regulator